MEPLRQIADLIAYACPFADLVVAAWEQGKTGVPLVDAGMRQLVATGWLHHILRHVVACFLTRGADTVVIVMALPC